jgi:hypothetical protein
MSTVAATNSFFQRLFGAAALDVAIYEEVEADPRAGVQAAAVVVLSSLAAGVGAKGFGDNTALNIAFVSVGALMAWACWALVILQVGGRLLPEPQTAVDVGQLMRTIGFAATPGLIQVFGFIPGVTLPAFIVASIWMLMAMVVAVRQALDYQGTARAVLVCVIGWALALGVAFALGLFLGPTVS